MCDDWSAEHGFELHFQRNKSLRQVIILAPEVTHSISQIGVDIGRLVGDILHRPGREITIKAPDLRIAFFLGRYETLVDEVAGPDNVKTGLLEKVNRPLPPGRPMVYTV